MILLYTSETSFLIIPKRAFADDAQLYAFMELLLRKVPNGIVQPRRGTGFAVLSSQAG